MSCPFFTTIKSGNHRTSDQTDFHAATRYHDNRFPEFLRSYILLRLLLRPHSLGVSVFRIPKAVFDFPSSVVTTRIGNVGKTAGVQFRCPEYPMPRCPDPR